MYHIIWYKNVNLTEVKGVGHTNPHVQDYISIKSKIVIETSQQDDVRIHGARIIAHCLPGIVRSAPAWVEKASGSLRVCLNGLHCNSEMINLIQSRLTKTFASLYWTFACQGYQGNSLPLAGKHLAGSAFQVTESLFFVVREDDSVIICPHTCRSTSSETFGKCSEWFLNLPSPLSNPL